MLPQIRQMHLLQLKMTTVVCMAVVDPTRSPSSPSSRPRSSALRGDCIAAVCARDADLMRVCLSEWMFKPLSKPNTCEVHFKVTFEVASFLHANAIQLFFDDVALTQLNAFVGRTKKLQQLRARQVPPQQSVVAASNAPASPRSPVDAASSTPPPQEHSTQAASLSDDFSIPGASLERINNYNASAAEVASNKIKQSMRTQDFEEIKAVFDQYAVDDGTKMYFAGFSKACRQLAVEYDDFRDISASSTLAGTIFSSLEVSGTQKDWLNMDEFVVGVYLMTKGTVEEKARSLFLVIDTSQDGKISREELTNAMQRRIHTVKRIFPKLLTDQVELQMESDQVKQLEHCTDEAVSRGLEAIESLMKDIEKEIPLAVNQIFLEADLDQDDFITEDEWLFAWHLHPEFVELMTIDGMKKLVQWASVVKTEESEHDDTRLTHVD